MDQYQTISATTEEVLFKEKGSKFYCKAFVMTRADELSELIAERQLAHPKAGHHCYAYRLGPNGEKYRANDDGEPANTAGAPILGQLQAAEVTNVLVVVTRIFGGTKLGVGGLIQAYREGAKQALSAARIVKRLIEVPITVQVSYPQLGTVLRLIEQHEGRIVQMDQQEDCIVRALVRKSSYDRLKSDLANIYPISFLDEDAATA